MKYIKLADMIHTYTIDIDMICMHMRDPTLNTYRSTYFMDSKLTDEEIIEHCMKVRDVLQHRLRMAFIQQLRDERNHCNP